MGFNEGTGDISQWQVLHLLADLLILGATLKSPTPLGNATMAHYVAVVVLWVDALGPLVCVY